MCGVAFCIIYLLGHYCMGRPTGPILIFVFHFIVTCPSYNIICVCV